MGLIKEKNETKLVKRFRKSIEKIALIQNRYDIGIIPYIDPDLPHFQALDSVKQGDAVYYAELYLTILENSKRSSTNFANNADALWEAIVELKLRPPSDLFHLLSDDDKIEVYNSHGVQVWRNFNVMKICSYTLEEMHCFSWDARYFRKESDTKAILASVQKVLTAKESVVFPENIANHIVSERFSQKRYVLEARHDYFCPLFTKENQVGGFIVTSKVEVLGSNVKKGAPQTSAPRLQVES